jgi:hypothetical protein
MDSQWFEVLFKGDYDDVMNNIADYVNYSYSAGIDGDYNDNHSFDNDDDNSNDKGKLFWKKEFDHHKLVLSTTDALSLYYMLIYISNPVCILTTLECDN